MIIANAVNKRAMVVDGKNSDMEENSEFRYFSCRVSVEDDIILVKGFTLSSRPSSPHEATSDDQFSYNSNNNNCLPSPLSCHQNGISTKQSVKTPKYLAMFNSKEENGISNPSSANKSGFYKLESADRIFNVYSLEDPTDDWNQTFLKKVEKSSAEAIDEFDESHVSKNSELLLLCFSCRMSFTFGPAFAGHVVNCHGLDLSDRELNLFERREVNAILRITEEGCHVLFLEPVLSTESEALKKKSAEQAVPLLEKGSDENVQCAVSSPAVSSFNKEFRSSPDPSVGVSSVSITSSPSMIGAVSLPARQPGFVQGMAQVTDAESYASNSGGADPIFPMSLFQSRNSCKTLKCPKCNWHYKYRQTLDAHMKEKHFEETTDCVFCNAGKPHPRLSRGESYSCGYKPFKCNVCNYSTTTKGNLSIHMQSDKHLYNARSLQQRQQEQMRQGGSGSSGFPHPPSQSNEEKTSKSESMTKQSGSPISSKQPDYSGSALDKQVQARRRRSSSKTNSSVDSGVYSAVSKSDAASGGRRESSSSSGGKWRCDVCCYETRIARNLRIHMTSEKHAQNLALKERGLLKHLRQDEDAARGRAERQHPAEISQMSAPNLLEYYAAAVKSLQQNTTADAAAKALPLPDDVRKAHAQYLQQQLFLAQQQQLILAQQYQQLMMAAASNIQQRALQSSNDEASSTTSLYQSKQHDMLRQSQLWKQLLSQTNPDTGLSPDAKPPNVAPAGENSHIFSCGLCCVYGTDDLAKLEAHVQKPRHTDAFGDQTSSEWVVRTRQRDKESYYCKLCSYSTPLKTNFNLHCKTEKHTSKLNLISHVREGGAATSWMIPLIFRGNMAQSVTCNACQFVTHSFEKLKLHCSTESHQTATALCQHLRSLMDSQSKSEAETKVDPANPLQYRCSFCLDFSSENAVEVVKHMRSVDHQAQVQNQKSSLPSSLEEVITIERADQTRTSPGEKLEEMDMSKTLDCEYCNYSCGDRVRMQLHVMTQHSDHPPTSCPLCQELLKSPLQLRLHLLEVHQLQVAHGGAKKTEESGEAATDEESVVTTSRDGVVSGDFFPPHSTDPDPVPVKDEVMNTSEREINGELVIDENADEQMKFGQEIVEAGCSSGGLDVSNLTESNDKILSESASAMLSNESDFLAKKDGDEEFSRKEGPMESQAANDETSSSVRKADADSNPLFSEFRTSDSLFRSCPNLVDYVNETASSSPSSRDRSRDVGKRKRSRMRSFPTEESNRSTAYRHLLSKYGLEQARHYVENRSSRNKNRARAFRFVKSEQKWSSSLSEPEASEKEVMTGREEIVSGKFPENESGVEKKLVTCSHCGKKFSDVWVLKTHEEVAHGVCVPTENIEGAADVYSNQLVEKMESDPSQEAPGLPEKEARVEGKNSPANAVFSTEVNNAKSIGAFNQGNLGQLSFLQQQQQQMQSQAFLQALMKMQAMQQAGRMESELGRNVSLEDFHSGSAAGDASSASANILSQMGLYSALLQTQSLGLHPYQMLSNVAAFQQMQHLATPGLLGLSEDPSSKTPSSVYSNSVPSSSSAGLFEGHQRVNSFDALQKQPETSNLLEGTSPLLPGHAQGQQSLEVPTKRPRTRITDEQLKILRANFDINNSPSEDQVDEMARRTTLPPKVIKHWFRNTLFKERQRSKDSPYNFNIPPVLSLEDAQKSTFNKQEELPRSIDVGSGMKSIGNGKKDFQEDALSSESFRPAPTDERSGSSRSNNSSAQKMQEESNSNGSTVGYQAREKDPNFSSALFANALSLAPSLSPKEVASAKHDLKALGSSRENQSLLALSSLSFPKQMLSSSAWPNLSSYESGESSMYENPEGPGFSSLSSGICRRTPRTRFTDFQLQVLQEFFDQNAYPKDDDLDKLSQTLNLSTRVIVVWFQNARQKARKSYENQQQQQFSRQSNSPLDSSDHVRNHAKVNDLSLMAVNFKEVEDFSLNNNNNPKSKTAIAPEKVSSRSASTAGEKLDVPTSQQTRVGDTSKEGSTMEKLFCQLCEKDFTSLEEWQANQQEHIKTMFGQYGQVYAQNLAGHRTAAEELEAEALQEEFPFSNSKMARESEADVSITSSLSSSAGFSVKANNNNNSKGNDSLVSRSKILSSDSSSLPHTGQSHAVNASLGDASKRRTSTSPTLPHFTASKAPLPPSTGHFHSRMSSFVDEKEGNGVQKDPKRLRTTITPEQLEYLYQQYLFDSSPSRKVIEQISEMVGLKKRVVQVWFQNTRARERKGQFRSSIARCVGGQMSQSKLCQLCRMVFRNKEELDHHTQTKHSTHSTESSAAGYTQDGPAEKKIKLSTQTGSSDALPSSDRTIYQAVKSMLAPDQMNATAKDYTNTSSISSSNPRNVKSEPSQTDLYTAVATPSSYAKQEFDYQKILEKSTPLNKLAALYTNSAVKEGSYPPISVAQIKSEDIPVSRTFHESVASEPSNSRKSPLEESRVRTIESVANEQADKSRDMLQPIAAQSSALSMLVNHSTMDMSYTPTKRHRTHMSSAQVRALRHCYKAFKTPSLSECELIGKEIGLLKRVVQVWFQNTRAKEKKRKAKLSGGSSADDHLEREEPPKKCDICLPLTSSLTPQQARHHYFSRDHLQRLMSVVEIEKKNEAGLNASHGSPCSSYDSFDNLLHSDLLGSETSSDATSPVMMQNHERSRSPPSEMFGNGGAKSSGNLAADFSSANIASSERSQDDVFFGNDRKSSASELSRQEQLAADNSSQFFAANPGLYQKAFQQLFIQQQQENQEAAATTNGEAGTMAQQALLQQALQKSLYQILKLPQTSSTE